MSRTPSPQNDEVELRVSLPGGVRVLVVAPASSSGLTAELLGYISLFRPSATVSAVSEAFFELVSEPGATSMESNQKNRGPETRDQIQRTFAPCPAHLFWPCQDICMDQQRQVRKGFAVLGWLALGLLLWLQAESIHRTGP